MMRGRALVAGNAEGEAVRVEAVSFFGDVNAETGRLADGRSIADKILVAKRGKGSTVGPYVMYALKKRGLAPRAILLTSRSDPVLVAGAVIAEIVLIDSLPEEILAVADGQRLRVRADGSVEVEGAQASP